MHASSLNEVESHYVIIFLFNRSICFFLNVAGFLGLIVALGLMLFHRLATNFLSGGCLMAFLYDSIRLHVKSNNWFLVLHH